MSGASAKHIRKAHPQGARHKSLAVRDVLASSFAPHRSAAFEMLGFVESRNVLTTEAAQPQWTAPRFKPSELRQRFNQRLLSLSSVETQTAQSPSST